MNVKAGGAYSKPGLDKFLVSGHHGRGSLWKLDNLLWRLEFWKHDVGIFFKSQFSKHFITRQLTRCQQ